MSPENAWKITDILIFQTNKQIDHVSKNYKLSIVKRFEFSSEFQSNSVIIKNNLDDSYRYFIKGAPEKISRMCCSKSLPKDFSALLQFHCQSGFCLIACATKPIQFYNEDKDFNRDFFDENLIFLGFIIYKSNLKSDSINVIRKIKDTNTRLIMATGDNPFTSISVAMEAGFVEHSDDIFFCNLEKKLSGIQYLKWYNLNMKEKNNPNAKENLIANKKISPYSSSNITADFRSTL